LKIEIACSIF